MIIGSKQITKVTCFGLIFIVGGIISIASALIDNHKYLSAPYKQEVVGNVITLRTEREHTRPDDSDRAHTVYCTEEEIEINGVTSLYEFKYSTDPEGEVIHTIISEDGVNWEFTIADIENTIMCCVAGVIFVLIGTCISYYF